MHVSHATSLNPQQGKKKNTRTFLFERKKMKGLLHFLLAKIILLALASSFVYCYEPSPLQDYCVATNETNGGNLTYLDLLIFFNLDIICQKS